ncbi:acetylornithine deacetylase [Rhodothermaceae bacterium RA]|nr:acetylornithine deacetylase [Rhodothermaceae bacterium RA]
MLAALASPARSQPARADLEALTAAHAPASYALLRDLLRIPNDAHDPDHVAQNVAYMDRAFRQRGFETAVLPTDGGPPLLLATRPAPGATKTLLVYLQIDGQPVDSSAWHQASPYEPVLKEARGEAWVEIPWARLSGEVDPDWRVFARSASDAKGPVAMFLTALDIARAEGLEPSVHLKVIMDFEEELGSPHLPAAVERYRDRLAADGLVIFDGPRHASNRPTLTFGARGIATLSLTVFGPRTPQHSGHYGNYVPNPAVRLARLIASMKDDAGRVTIPGFYDGVHLSDAERALLARVPDDEAAIQTALGIAAPDSVGATLQEAIQYPSLNVRGMAAGWVGPAVRTIIPATATAEFDLRLVPESDPERLIGLVRAHIEAQGYRLVDGEPSDLERMTFPKLAAFSSRIAYTAFRTPVDSELGRWLTAALERAFGEPPVIKPMSGGSIPISPFVTTLGLPAVTVPTVNPDNNQHSPNENLRLGNYQEGIQTFLAILTQPFPN